MAHQDPRITERPIRPDGAQGARLSARDLDVLTGILDRNLKHDCGYRYFEARRGFQIPPMPAGEREWTVRPEGEPVRDAA